MLLSVFVGSGAQVLIMTLVTLVFACFGFLSPANRGALMTCAMFVYVCLGTPAGYVSSRLYKMMGGDRWKANVLLTALLCPGKVTHPCISRIASSKAQLLFQHRLYSLLHAEHRPVGGRLVGRRSLHYLVGPAGTVVRHLRSTDIPWRLLRLQATCECVPFAISLASAMTKASLCCFSAFGKPCSRQPGISFVLTICQAGGSAVKATCDL